MKKITPVLLAGGTGERLWPLSRKSYPKQFAELVGNKSLFQQAALRLSDSDILAFNPLITVTNEEFRFIVKDELANCSKKIGEIIIEADRKNTAPAILAATLVAFKQDPESVILVTPSDHFISSTEGLHRSVKQGLNGLNDSKIVIFGVTPTRPETGYGYIEVEENKEDDLIDVLAFIEKPSEEVAKKIWTRKNFFWNSGIFLFNSRDLITAFEKKAKGTMRAVYEAVNEGHDDIGFFRLDKHSWAKCPSQSLDYAIMEKIENISVVSLKSDWSDMGGWDSIWEHYKDVERGNVVSQNAHAIDCENVLLRSESSSQQLVGLGLKNIMAISMRDAVLVLDRSKAQEVKKVVGSLQEKKLSQADNLPRDHRPWGWFEVLSKADQFQVKCINVNPWAMLSLQSHQHRSEHWIVIEGTATVTIGDLVTTLKKGESIFVPLKTKHRLENASSEFLTILEVQTGSYFGEDDIERYDDIYARK